jgi:hypothetical protein
MTPQERMKFFWATGFLPGTMADDLNDRNVWQPAQPRRRRVNWLRLISLGLLG